MDTNKYETINELFNDLKESLNTSKLSAIEAELADKAFREIGKGNFDEADELLKQALSINPKYSIAYFGRFLVEHKARTINDLIEPEDIFKNSVNYQRILQYPNQTLIKLIKNLKFERKRLKNLYTQFKDKLEKAENIDETLSLSKTFEEILNYKNSIYLLQNKQFLICKQQFSSASTIDEIKSLLECFKTVINEYLLKDLGNIAFERLYEEKLRSAYTIEDIVSVTESFKEFLNNKSLKDLETRAYIKTCKADLLSASTIEDIISTLVNYKNLIDNKLLKKLEKDSFERLFKDKLKAASSIEEIISTSETFKELLNYNLLETLEKEALEKLCKTKLRSAKTVEEIVTISNSFKELINNELLIELEVGIRFYRYISCSEAELEYLKKEITKNDSELIDTNKTELEKKIKQIEQELKGTYIRGDETDIERYTRYLKALSLELDDCWERYNFYWYYYDKLGGKAREDVDREDEESDKLAEISDYYKKCLEVLNNK